MEYQVKLDAFEGPLDLLLHLIKKNKINIYDIPIAVITRQYLEYLDLMRVLNIEVAGEFLVMAATLAHIKSRMLLPQPQTEDEEDPRLEIVRPLLELLEIQGVAEELVKRPLLDRDVFCRDFVPDEVKEGDEEKELAAFAVGIFDLIDAFRRLMEKEAVEHFMDITLTRISLSEKIDEILNRLSPGQPVSFHALFTGPLTRRGMILTFIALLEITRLGLIHIWQRPVDGEIELQLK